MVGEKKRFYRWLLALLGMPSLLLAQSGSGSIQGTVKDSTGAILPKTVVHVANKDTGRTIDTTTNEVGFYSVPGLFAGNYVLTFSAEGMQRYQVSIALQVAQTAVVSPEMSAGSVTEQVTVSGNAIQLATYDSGTISSQLDNARINQLPMNGRNILTLTGITTPGLEANGTRSNGNMAAGLEYVLDGAPLSNRNVGGPTIQPDPDAVQEVKIETTNSNAKFATPATAILTTKSGTNSLHGTFFETARNNAFGVAKARQDPYNLVAPHLVRNEFGASVGGPIVLPKLYDGRDKTFFFFAYERYSNRQMSNELVYVPTQAMRNGDFSGLINSQGQLQVLYDSNTTNPITFTRQAFPNNQVPMSRLSPLAKTLYAITPLPSGPTAQANPLVSSNYTAAGINNTTRPTITIRLDHAVDENNRLYLRYNSINSTTTTLRNYPNQNAGAIAGAGLPAGVTNLQQSPTVVYSVGLGYTHVFSSTFVSETILGNQWENDNIFGGGNTSANYETVLGLPNNFGQPGFPQIGGTNLLMNYSGTQFNYDGSQILTNIDENLTKTINRHQLFFGGRYRHERLGVLPDRTPDVISFNGMATGQLDPGSGKNYTAAANTGNANADLFVGGASSYSQQLNPPYQHWRSQEFDAYLQDDFHVNDHLTLNMGLRWEAHPVATEKHNVFNGFDFNNRAVVIGKPISEYIALGYTTQTIITNLQNLGVKFETPDAAGLPEHMVYSNNLTFSPRVGFAYAPFGNGRGTVIRAGFGRYIYPIPTRNFYASGKLNAPFAANYAQSYIAANQSPDGQPNYLLRTPQTVIAGLNSSNVVNTNQINSIIPGGPTEFVLNPRYPPNYVTQMNATIEQPLKPSAVLRVSYLWNHGSNLDQQNNHNQALTPYVWEVTTGTLPPTGPLAGVALNPYDNRTYGGLTTDDRTGWSNDNALQVNYQRMYKSGYAYQVFYVFSRAMRVGGNTFRDGQVYPYANFAPGIAPTSDPDELNRFENYQIDTAIPKHRVGFNGIVDLPIGSGKLIFGHANRLVNELIGGYQIAAAGTVASQYFQPAASNWGPVAPLQLNKKKYRVNDCSSGVCRPGYQWFNGFVSPLLTNNPCGPSPISGIPSSEQPYSSPINLTPGNITCVNGVAKAGNANYLSNNIPVKLANGTTVTTPYAPGPSGANIGSISSSAANPFYHSVLNGPFNWSADLSVFKVFPISEVMNVRINVDAFNVFNVQGYTNPNTTTGIQNFTQSYNAPRQIQLTARFTF